jgi:DNA-binding IclR family transcriptional regulator
VLEGLAGVLVTGTAALLMGGLTGLVAAGKGHPFWTWAAVGVLLPVLGLVVVMAVLPNRAEPAEGPSHTAVDAARRSVVARAFAGGPASRSDLVERTRLPERRVRLELSGLANLGMAERDGTLWELSATGAAALEDAGAADDPVAGAVRASAAAVALRTGPATERQIADRADLTRRQARLQLFGLDELDVAARDEEGRWQLTERGRELLAADDG